MSTIIDTLITNRTQEDVGRVYELKKKIMDSGLDSLTQAERTEYFSGMRGAYNASDMNRVGEACDFIYNYLKRYIGYAPENYEPSKTDWNEQDVPTVAQANHYMRNVRCFHKILGTTQELPERNLDNLDYEGANNIEKALVDAYGLAQSIRANYIYCGIPYCGQVPMVPRAGLGYASLISKQSPNLDFPGLLFAYTMPVSETHTIAVHWNGDGVLSVSSSDESVATVSIRTTGATTWIDITAVSVGNCSITASVSGTDMYEAQSGTMSLTAIAAKQSPNLRFSGGDTQSRKEGATSLIQMLWDGDGELIYCSSSDPSVATVSLNELNPDGINVNSISQGTATISVTVSETAAYQSETATLTLTVEEEYETITMPSQSGTLTYSGSSQSPTWSGYDSTKMTIGGTTSGTNAGSYTATFTPKSGYQWSDGTTTAKNVTWTIGKARASIVVSQGRLDLNEGESATLTVTRSGSGAISVVTAFGGYVTTSVSGTTVTVTAIARGQETIGIFLEETTNYTGAETYVPVYISQASTKTLDDYTWSEISTISQAGTGDTYWDIGDTKMITLNGTVGTQAYNNVSLGVFILDFNHPENGVSDNNIIWGGFKTAATGGKDVALCLLNNEDPCEDGSKVYNINHWGNYNHGGWKGCDLRYDILGATETPPSGYGSSVTEGRMGYDATQTAITSPVASTLMAALPSDFRNALRLRTHWVDNVGGGDDVHIEAKVTAVTDAISLLAEFEIFGSRYGANKYEQERQSQMEYYKNGASKVRYFQDNHNPNQIAINSAEYWWQCSPNNVSQWAFLAVNKTGDPSTSGTSFNYSLAPVFKT